MANTLPKLTIAINSEGEVSTDFTHFIGQGCLAAGEKLHTLLAEYGIATEVTLFTPKPELLTTPSSSGTVMHAERTAVLQEGEYA
jgi:hypothetical protein